MGMDQLSCILQGFVVEMAPTTASISGAGTREIEPASSGWPRAEKTCPQRRQLSQKAAINGRRAMKIPRRRFVHRIVGVAALPVIFTIVTGLSSSACSQTARTIKIVVPYAAGGPADILARLFAEQIGRARELTMAVENRAGAGSVIGTEAVSRAAPDGSTLLINGPPIVISPHLRKLNYNPLTGFEPICYLVRSQMVVVVNSASPYRTLADLLDAARAKPGDLTLANASATGTTGIAFEMLKRVAKINITAV